MTVHRATRTAVVKRILKYIKMVIGNSKVCRDEELLNWRSECWPSYIVQDQAAVCA